MNTDRVAKLERALELAVIRLQWCSGYISRTDEPTSQTIEAWAQEALDKVSE